MDVPCAYTTEKPDGCLRKARLDKERLIKMQTHYLCLCRPIKIKDLSQGIGDVRHFYYECCGTHIYDGKRYTKHEWEEYINGKEQR